MGVIQSGINKIVAGVSAGKLLSQKMKQGQQNAEDVKLARLKQRTAMEQYRAKYQEAKLKKIQAKYKQKEIREESKKPVASIGGIKINDPELLKKIKEASK